MQNVVLYTFLNCIEEVSVDFENLTNKIYFNILVSNLHDFKKNIKSLRPEKILIDGKLPISFIKILASETFRIMGIYDISSNVFVFSEGEIKVPGVIWIKNFSELTSIN